jgi:hypothetical protein
MAMAEILDLQARLRPVSPLDMLERLAMAAADPERRADWSDPLVQVQLRSGTSMRGHLIAVGAVQGERDRHFLLKLQPKSDTHLSRDIAYVNGADVEAIFIFDIDLFVDALPAIGNE